MRVKSWLVLNCSYKDVIEDITYADVARKMKICRLQYRPRNPRDVPHLAELLGDYAPMQNFYRGSIYCEKDDSTSLIFITDHSLAMLKNKRNGIDHFFMDGTFRVSNSLFIKFVKESNKYIFVFTKILILNFQIEYFQVLPHHPKFSHLYTIHYRKCDTVKKYSI